MKPKQRPSAPVKSKKPLSRDEGLKRSASRAVATNKTMQALKKEPGVGVGKTVKERTDSVGKAYASALKRKGK